LVGLKGQMRFRSEDIPDSQDAALQEVLVPQPKAADIRPFIPASDFALSKRFYAALGWRTCDVGPGLALVTLGDGQNFYIQDYYVKEVAENCMLHVTVEDAQAWHAHVASALAGVAFPGARVQPPARQPYGASVVFVHDPCGVLLHLCEWDR
jgi:catechol 2,3-dioxygenase-like lactoylglutathione lyase family enzyme